MGADTSLILLRDMSDTPHAYNDLNKLSTQFACLGHEWVVLRDAT